MTLIVVLIWKPGEQQQISYYSSSLSSKNCSQWIKELTKGKNTLDLVLTTENDIVENVLTTGSPCIQKLDFQRVELKALGFAHRQFQGPTGNYVENSGSCSKTTSRRSSRPSSRCDLSI